jgi:hypothetical protein
MDGGGCIKGAIWRFFLRGHPNYDKKKSLGNVR